MRKCGRHDTAASGQSFGRAGDNRNRSKREPRHERPCRERARTRPLRTRRVCMQGDPDCGCGGGQEQWHDFGRVLGSRGRECRQRSRGGKRAAKDDASSATPTRSPEHPCKNGCRDERHKAERVEVARADRRG